MTLTIHPLRDVPEIRPGDDLARHLLDAIDRDGLTLTDGDVLVVTHKVVSKAEGAVVEVLDDVDYRALVERGEVRRDMVSDVVDKAFAGRVSDMVSHLLREGDFDRDELEALRAEIAAKMQTREKRDDHE